jgi:hypothetical protein
VFADGDAAPHKALFASVGSGGRRLYELALDQLSDPRAQVALVPIELDQPVRDVVPVPGRDLALVVHDDARTVVGVLDLTTTSTSSLLGVGELDSYDFSPDGSTPAPSARGSTSPAPPRGAR